MEGKIFSYLTLIERNFGVTKGLVMKEAARTCVTLWIDGPMLLMITHGNDLSIQWDLGIW